MHRTSGLAAGLSNFPRLKVSRRLLLLIFNEKDTVL